MAEWRTTNITFLSTKGGTGKTTLSAHVAGVLSGLGRRTLLIDADLRQPSLSNYFDLAVEDRPGLAWFLQRDSWVDAIRQTPYPNLDIVISDGDSIEDYIERQPAGRLLLLHRLQELATRKAYRYVVIDSWGSTGAVTEMAALAGTDHLICPTLPEKLSAFELLRSTLSLIGGLGQLAAFGGIAIPTPQILFNAVSRTRDAQEIMAFLRERLREEDVRFLDTVIPRRAAFNNAASACVPVFEVESPSDIAAAGSATRAIGFLLVELMPRLKKSFQSHARFGLCF